MSLIKHHILRSVVRKQLLSKHAIHKTRRSILTSAITRGATEPPLLECTIGEHFRGIVDRYGDRLAVISHHQNIKLTYDALDRDSDRLARGLKSIGVKRGDRVAVSLGNNAEYATLTYAVFKLGAILVPLNPGFNAPQVISALSHLTATHLIIGAETNLSRKPPRSNVSLLTEIVPNIAGHTTSADGSVQSEAVPSLRKVIVVDNSHGRIDVDAQLSKALRYEDVCAEGGGARKHSSSTCMDEKLDANDIINIQFTSGTTSMPKAASLTHRNILNNGKSIGDRMLLTERDVVCCPPPLFHCFGCVLGYMATATHGSAIVFPTEAFDPHATLTAVRDHACTALYGVPTMFIAELDLLSDGAIARDGLSQLRTGIAAGSSIPAELMRRLHKNLHLTELTICYGMTETSPVSCMTTTEDPIEKRVSSVGRVMPHVAVKIVDPLDRTRVLGIGERGEVVTGGYLVMKGYWGDVTRTNEVIVDNDNGDIWMHTGDEGFIDSDGYITITGRIKDLIIRGGENIHPLEIENCLLAHPQVSDVSVVGLPDERYGEAVAAFIIARKDGKQLEPSKDMIREWVRTKLSNHLAPKHVFWVEAYPKTASGKIQKFKLKELGVEMLKNDGLVGSIAPI